MRHLRGRGASAFFACLALAAFACADRGRESLDGTSRGFAVFAPTAPAGPPREAPRSRETGSSQAVLARKAQPPTSVSSPSGGGSFLDARHPFRQPAARAGLRPSNDAELLSELTKPAYLHVRLLATPTNHRAPPA